MTAHKQSLEHLLLLQALEDDQIEDLKKQFKTVTYVPRKNAFGPLLDGESNPTKEQLREADVIFSFVIPDTMESIEDTPNLKLFQGLSAGYGHLTSTKYFQSLPKDTAKGPTFASASGIHVSTIGEHCLATVMMLYHRLHLIYHRMRSDESWYKDVLRVWHNYIRELRGLRVGILGYGHIGRETARLFAACGSKIVAMNRDGKPSPETGYIIEGTGDPSGSLPERYYSTSDPESRTQFFADCDVVINTLPDSEATRGFVGRNEITAMRGDAVYVNIGRGTTTDQDALVEALKASPASGEAMDATGTLRIGGASLDVTTPEPLPDGHPLYSLENVIVTPHMSGLSLYYYKRAVDLLLVNTDRLRSGKAVFNVFRGQSE